MKKIGKKWRSKIIVLTLSGVMLLPFWGKNKEKILTNVEKIYSMYFTNDDTLPTISQVEKIPEVGWSPEKPVTQNKETEEPTYNEDKVTIVDENELENGKTYYKKIK